MITVALIFLLLILTLTCFAVFRRRLFLYPKSETEKLLPPRAPKAVSLFAPTDDEIKAFEKEESEKLLAERRAEIRRNLIQRIKEDDFGALNEAKDNADSVLYQELLDLLAEKIKLEPEKLHKLVCFVSKNQLPTSEGFTRVVLANWLQTSPKAVSSLGTALHIAALSGSAQAYLEALEITYRFWQQGNFGKVSGEDFVSLFGRHYYLLPPDAKASGAGFLIKEKLASVRREVLGK